MTQAVSGGGIAFDFSNATHNYELIQEALRHTRPVELAPFHARVKRESSASKGKRSQDVYSRAPKGRHFPDDPKPSDHLLFLHGGAGSATRWVCLRRLQPVNEQIKVEGLRNLPSMKVSLPALLSHIDALIDEPNLYLAQADFFWGDRNDKHRHRSRAKYLQSIATIFVDLDVYNVKQWNGVSIDEVGKQVLRVCREAGVPEPVLISSGRGLYANWKLDRRVNLRDSTQSARWQRLQRQMMALLQDFGPDPKVRDATRILRLIGSVNPRSGTRVSVLHDDGAVYSLETLENCARTLSDTLYAPASDKPNASKSGTIARAKRDHSGKPDGLTSTSSAATLIDEPLSDPEALDFLRTMLKEDEALIGFLPRTRRYQYGLFKDIAQVVLNRGGIAYGARDEFVFWLLVTRFNAGLYEAKDLPGLAARFAGLTQGGLNLWEAGMLSTLYARMTAQVEQQGSFVQIKPVIRRKGAFAAIRSFSARQPRERERAAKAEKAEFTRPLVYTPKASTLIERLGITREEQQGLSYLISPEEHLRRDRAASPTAQRTTRNERIVRELAKGKRPVTQIAKRNKISVATAYRIRAQQPEIAQQKSLALQQRSNQRTAVLALYRADPSLSMREIAKKVGVSTSSVYRWIQAAQEQAERTRQLDQNKRVIQVLKEVALPAKKCFKRTPPKQGVSTLSACPIRKNTAVSHSQYSGYSNKGKAYVKVKAESKRDNKNDSNEIRVQIEHSEAKRFDFNALERKRKREDIPIESVSHALPASQSDGGVAHDWERMQAQAVRDQALLDTWIPEIPGMQQNDDLLLEVIALYATSHETALAEKVPEGEIEALRTAFELMLLNIEELEDPSLMDRAQELFITDRGLEMMQEAYDALCLIVRRYRAL